MKDSYIDRNQNQIWDNQNQFYTYTGSIPVQSGFSSFIIIKIIALIFFY